MRIITPLSKPKTAVRLSRRQKIEQEIKKLQNTDDIRVGLVAPRNAGKTSLLMSWYLFRTESRFTINFDETTLVYLRKVWGEFAEHGSTRATMAVAPKNIFFELHDPENDQTYKVETFDCSGHFFEPSDQTTEFTDYSRKVRKFLKKCDAILCLVDCNDDSSILNVLDAIDASLPNDTPHIVLVLTKFDTIQALPPSRDDYRKCISQLRQKKKMFKEVEQKIKAKRNRFRIAHVGDCVGLSLVPVSALGRGFLKGPVRRDEISPQHIYEPIYRLLSFRQERIRRLKDKETQLFLQESRKKLRDIGVLFHNTFVRSSVYLRDLKLLRSNIRGCLPVLRHIEKQVGLDVPEGRKAWDLAKKIQSVWRGIWIRLAVFAALFFGVIAILTMSLQSYFTG